MISPSEKSWTRAEDSTDLRILPFNMFKSRLPHLKLTCVLWLLCVLGDAHLKRHFNRVIHQIAALKTHTIVYFGLGMYEWDFASSAICPSWPLRVEKYTMEWKMLLIMLLRAEACLQFTPSECDVFKLFNRHQDIFSSLQQMCQISKKNQQQTNQKKKQNKQYTCHW